MKGAAGPFNKKMKDLPDLSGYAVLVINEAGTSHSGLEDALRGLGAVVTSVSDIDEAGSVLEKGLVNAVLSSPEMVDQRLIDYVKRHKTSYPDSFFYVLTEEDYDQVETSLDAVRMIVDDYIRKPVDPVRFARMVQTNLGRPSTGSTSLTIIEPLVTRIKPYFIFRSPAMHRALANISEMASSGQTVLISGETGTGKELVARAIHVMSPRANGPFIPVNCGAIPESLIEDELFGHEKGAFTGAIKTKKGKFEAANNGTLFLDEIGDMPLTLQVRLLRVLEDERLYRVGGERPITVNVRVIGASRVDLEKGVRDGLFREDLYYRLNVLRINLPPLRERIADIALLAVHFLERAFSEMGRVPPYPSLSAETLYLLEQYPWKGNVRELRNVMTRVATFLPPDTKHIFPFHIAAHLEDVSGTGLHASGKSGTPGVFVPVGMPLNRAEELIISETLRQTGGNRTKAAKLLGISLRTIRRQINKSRAK